MAWSKVTSEITPPTRWHGWRKTPGDSAQGVIVGVREGRFNAFVVLTQDDAGELNVPLKGYAGGDGKKTVEVVSALSVGTNIKIVYVGKVPGKRGAPRSHFDVYVESTE